MEDLWLSEAVARVRCVRQRSIPTGPQKRRRRSLERAPIKPQGLHAVPDVKRHSSWLCPRSQKISLPTLSLWWITRSSSRMTPPRLRRSGKQLPPLDFGSMYQAPTSPPALLPYTLMYPRSLKNHGVDDEVDQMFAMGAETMSLPLSEKMEFEQGDSGMSFGYKAAGANAVDESGNLDTVEFINVAQDDALAWPESVHRTYPRTVNARMDDAIVPFVEKSRAINVVLLKVLERKLGFPEGELLKKHAEEEPSASETRCIKSPPHASQEEDKTAIGAHTDFGSLVCRTAPSSISRPDSLQSFLHNRLGGLQVMVPGTEEWQYVKVVYSKLATCNG